MKFSDALSEIHYEVLGSHSEDGANKWWYRERTVLNGLTPMKYLQEHTTADEVDEEAFKKLREIAIGWQTA